MVAYIISVCYIIHSTLFTDDAGEDISECTSAPSQSLVPSPPRIHTDHFRLQEHPLHVPPRLSWSLSLLTAPRHRWLRATGHLRTLHRKRRRSDLVSHRDLLYKKLTGIQRKRTKPPRKRGRSGHLGTRSVAQAETTHVVVEFVELRV